MSLVNLSEGEMRPAKYSYFSTIYFKIVILFSPTVALCSMCFDSETRWAQSWVPLATECGVRDSNLRSPEGLHIQSGG